MVKSKKNIYDLACCPHDSGTGVQVLRREQLSQMISGILKVKQKTGEIENR